MAGGGLTRFEGGVGVVMGMSGRCNFFCRSFGLHHLAWVISRGVGRQLDGLESVVRQLIFMVEFIRVWWQHRT